MSLLTDWLLPFALAANTAAILSVGNFPQGDLRDGQMKSFKGGTICRLTETVQAKALCARSKSTVSSIYRRLSVDLTCFCAA